MTIKQEIAELRAMVEALEAKYETMRLATLEWGKDVDKVMRWSDQHLLRIERLETGATCPHIVSSDEGTSYCDLALQTAAAQPASAAAPAPAGGLVELVAGAIGQELSPAAEARAAIREVAAWLRVESEGRFGSGLHWSRRLEQEADR
jgi:hypothetical protein